jgi:hypothetical protein
MDGVAFLGGGVACGMWRQRRWHERIDSITGESRCAGRSLYTWLNTDTLSAGFGRTHAATIVLN